MREAPHGCCRRSPGPGISTRRSRRPEGNITGVTLIAAELSAKRVELLHEIAPSATRGCAVNPNNPGLMQDNVLQLSVALHRLGLEMLVLKAGSESEIEGAFATAVQHGQGRRFGEVANSQSRP
jgi:putative ABC transport system substrate-binding protein